MYSIHFILINSSIKSIEMIENIRTEFRQILRETEWMDEESRKKAIEKVKYEIILEKNFKVCLALG